MYAVSFFANRLISKNLVFLDCFFGPSHFFRKTPAFCLCFLSWQKRFNKQNLQKKCCLSELRAPPRRELIARPAPARKRAKQGNPHKLCTSKFHDPTPEVLTLFFGRSASTEPLRRKRRAWPPIGRSAPKKFGESLVLF